MFDFLKAILTALVILAFVLRAQAAQPAKADNVDTEAVVRAVAGYRDGDDRKPLAAVEQLVRRAGSVSGDEGGTFRRDLAGRMARLLASPQTTSAAKAFLCRQLAEIASEEDAPAVASLLPDERLAAVALAASRAFPARPFNGLLRDALKTLRGDLRIGAVNALGQRRDHGSVEALATMLAGADSEPASAAAGALGRIGGNAAAAALAAPCPARKGGLGRRLPMPAWSAPNGG